MDVRTRAPVFRAYLDIRIRDFLFIVHMARVRITINDAIIYFRVNTRVTPRIEIPYNIIIGPFRHTRFDANDRILIIDSLVFEN